MLLGLSKVYGAGNYSIVGPYKRFCIKSSEWHSWDENWRKDHVQKFRSFVPGKLTYSPNQGTVEESLVIRCAEPDMINDCQESNANSDKEQTSSQEEAYL